MTQSSPTVFIVDNNSDVRESLQWLLESVELPVRSFCNGPEFLNSDAPYNAGCLILDLKMPGMDGLKVFERLKNSGSNLPVIILTGHGDIHSAVTAIKMGASDFVEKPFNDQKLIEMVQKAIRDGSRRASIEADIDELQGRYRILSPREKEVMDAVVGGSSNRIIAQDLGLSTKTIDFHRAKMMDKMEASSLAELISMVTVMEKTPQHA